MKRIEALIRPYKLREVKDALTAVGVDEITVSSVRSYGRQYGHKECYRGAEYVVEFVSKTRLDVLVSDALADEIVAAILTAARTGAAGDGKIFIRDFADAISVCIDDAAGVSDSADIDDADESPLPDEQPGKQMTAAALVANLSKLLGPAFAGWHSLFTYLFLHNGETP